MFTERLLVTFSYWILARTWQNVSTKKSDWFGFNSFEQWITAIPFSIRPLMHEYEMEHSTWCIYTWWNFPHLPFLNNLRNGIFLLKFHQHEWWWVEHAENTLHTIDRSFEQMAMKGFSGQTCQWTYCNGFEISVNTKKIL